MIRFACPQCHKGFQVEDKLGGRKTKCPNCNGTISIPVAAASHSSPAPTTKATPQTSAPSLGDPTRGAPTVIAGGGAGRHGPQASSVQPPSRIEAEQEPSRLSTPTKVVAGVGGAACLVAIGILVSFVASRDTWELHNASRVSGMLEEADRLQESDPLKAYKIYDDVLKEAKQHTITDEQLAQKLANAEKSRTATHQKLQEKLRAADAEKQRQAEEDRRAAAAEEQRLAEEEERKRAAEEAQRIAEEKRQAEEERRKEAIAAQQKARDAVWAAYRNAPQSARSPMNGVKKVAARTEIGINYKDYSTAVGEAWGEVKVFTESPEGKAVPAFSVLLISAMDKHRLALDVWRGQFDGGSTGFTFDEGLATLVIKECWRAANCRIDTAESLISNDNVESAFSRAAKLRQADEIYETTVRSLFDYLKAARLAAKYAEGGESAAYEKAAKKVVENIETLMENDSP